LPVARLVRFAAALLAGEGVAEIDAVTTAQVLVLADRRGIPSHGVARLPFYLKALAAGGVKPTPSPTVEQRRGAVQVWNADHGLGPPVSRKAMFEAIALAKRFGIGWVAVRNSGHFGIAAAYVAQAIDAGLIGMAMTNTDPIVAPTGSAERVLGTNPIAIGAPGAEGPAFLLDMATSVVPVGRLEVARRVGRTLPLGWAIDASGAPVDDAAAIEKGGALLPLGGSTIDGGGHKGYGLAAAVDLLCGVLPNTATLRDVHSLYVSGEPSSVGHVFIAVDPAAFGGAESFLDRASHWAEELRRSRPVEPGGQVLVAGDPEAAAEAENIESVPIHAATVGILEDLGERYGVSPDWTI
jgi:LDH2 family malate/lactate/ureidoglycolate dehydrogenase